VRQGPIEQIDWQGIVEAKQFAGSAGNGAKRTDHLHRHLGRGFLQQPQLPALKPLERCGRRAMLDQLPADGS
jgi:hypothetical protein